MFKSLLTFGLILGSLLLLIPQPIAGYTVAMKGNTYGEGYAEQLEEKDKRPWGDDGIPALKDDSAAVIEIPSDELTMANLYAAEAMTNDQIDLYLKKYGYLVPLMNESVSEKDRKNAVKEFQRFSRISETGVVDHRTVKQMKRSRCGLADPVSNNKLANFNTKGINKWKKKNLTYKIAKYSEKQPESIVKEWTAKAFKMWADATQLTFTEIESGKSDIRISFTQRKHGDDYPFDGPGGVLAHAFFPENGEVHMEEAENWTIKTSKGTNLLFVLVHEIGHALGLGHSSVDNAIMEPYYNGYTPNLKLHKDDIAGIQFLYGKPRKPEPTKAPVTKPPVTKAPPTRAPPTKAPATKAPATKAPVTKRPSPSPTTPTPEPTDPTTPTRKFLCPFPFWATITMGDRTFGFYRYSFYELLPNGRIRGRKSIKSVYRRGPRVVGAAAYNEETGHTFLFLGRKVWRYTNGKLDRGFPKKLAYSIRAAVVVDEQLMAFSFRHVHYLDEDTMEDYVDGEVTIADEYPGLPRSIRSITSYGDGLAYIFATRRLVRLDIYTGEIDYEKTCYKKKKSSSN